jgi:hypothetical protein
MKKFKVRITQIPLAKTGYQVDGALANDISSMGNRDYDKSMSKDPKSQSRYLTAVPREDANLEAEDGETAFGDINGDGFPEHKIIKGKRHSEGGVPLNLPDGTFIFSDTKSMKITDCNVLKMFSKPCGKKSYTPAELAKPYDINKYRVLLEDADTDEMTRLTAELMIKKYVIKLGALALAQEAKKGFPQGIPNVARPYMESVGLSEEDILPNDPNKMQQEEMSEENNIPQMPNDYDQPMQDQPDGSAPTQMPDGQPIAQPEPGMMQFGGMRSLRRANEGMEQMPEKEMMMQPQQQSGQDQQMMQVMQQISEALQQGAQPEEIAAELLQNQMAPQEVAQVFVELGMPEDQVEQLVMSAMQQMQGDQQQDSRQMEQTPMAQYGMSMGGYEFPFQEDMMMNPYFEDIITNANLKKFQVAGQVKGDPPIKTQDIKPVTVTSPSGKKIVATRREESPGPEYNEGTVEGNTGINPVGFYQEAPPKNVDLRGKVVGAGTKPNSKWAGSICDKIMNGWTAKELALKGHGNIKALEKQFADCFKQANEKFTDKAFYNDMPLPVKVEEVKEKVKEENKEEPCYCEYEDGTKEVVACPEDGSEPICPDKNPPPPETKEYIPTMYEEPYDDFYPEWRTQDINMARTIRGERHNKYTPYFSVPRAPEMQPVYKNWLGAVQSELANVAGNTLALQRSGPKNRALLTQIDNKPQEAIERTNTENVGTQNQAILQNLTAQEKNYFNLDKAKQRYQGESSFANQSYDNEINDWNFRKTLQQNLGLTNAANTYNEQTEQFAINPRTGVQIFKDGRLNRPTRDSSFLDQLAEAKASGLYPGIDDKTLLAAITSDRLNRSQYGGPLYAMGGYVYGNMTYPFDY